MAFWLLDPDGYRNNFGSDVATAEDAALIVLQMLITDGYDWVEMRSDEDPEWVTKWVSLERDEKGVVTKMGVQEFDGEMSVIDNSDYPGVWDEDLPGG